MDRRVTIHWTRTAKESMKALPKKVRRGLFDKIDALAQSDPREPHKPLMGPLQGYYRIAYSRYRAIYSVEEEKLAGGEILIHLKVMVVVVGQRKEGDKEDVYRLAERLVRLGIIKPDKVEQNESEGESE